MTKIVYSLLAIALSTSVFVTMATPPNARETLITAIARNDFGAVTKTLKEITDMTLEEKQHYLQMADQIIDSSIEWRTKHHNHMEIGKDSIKGFGYWIATIMSAFATAISTGIVLSTIEAKYNEDFRFRLGRLPALHYTVASTAILAGCTTYFGYKTIQKIVTAWMKPIKRLENALLIRDAIFQHEVTRHILYGIPDYHNNVAEAPTQPLDI